MPIVIKSSDKVQIVKISMYLMMKCVCVCIIIKMFSKQKQSGVIQN